MEILWIFSVRSVVSVVNTPDFVIPSVAEGSAVRPHRDTADEPQVPPLRFASVGMTMWGVALKPAVLQVQADRGLLRRCMHSLFVIPSGESAANAAEGRLG